MPKLDGDQPDFESMSVGEIIEIALDNSAPFNEQARKNLGQTMGHQAMTAIEILMAEKRPSRLAEATSLISNLRAWGQLAYTDVDLYKIMEDTGKLRKDETFIDEPTIRLITDLQNGDMTSFKKLIASSLFSSTAVIAALSHPNESMKKGAVNMINRLVEFEGNPDEDDDSVDLSNFDFDQLMKVLLHPISTESIQLAVEEIGLRIEHGAQAAMMASILPSFEGNAGNGIQMIEEVDSWLQAAIEVGYYEEQKILDSLRLEESLGELLNFIQDDSNDPEEMKKKGAAIQERMHRGATYIFGRILDEDDTLREASNDVARKLDQWFKWAYDNLIFVR